MDLRYYLSLFLRRLPYVLLFLVLGGAVGGMLAVLLPPVFRAEARLLVESEQIPGDLAASTVRTEASEQIQIIEQQILTRETLLEIANRLDIYAPMPGQAPVRLAADEIVDDLANRISIDLSSGGGGRGAQPTIVTVAFTAPTAQLASAVTNEVVTLILQENVEMRTARAGQTLDFFVQRVEQLDGELRERGAAIVAFQEANKDALPDSLDFRRSRLAAEAERLLQLEREEAALRDRRTRLVELYEATGRVDAGLSEAAMTPEQRELQGLRNELSAALAVMSPTNPRIRLLESRIAALEARVAGAPATDPNDGQLSAYDLQLADIDAQIESIGTQKAQISVNMEELQTSIEATPSNAVTLDTMQRDYANVRAQYDQAVSNRAAAETGETIETLSKGQRISIIEQAIPPREPQSPNRPLVAGAGLGGGLFLGLALVALLELLNRSIRRPVEITDKLGVMPFASLPLLRSRYDVRRRRLKIAGAFFMVAVVMPATLWLVHSQVMPLDLLVDRAMQRLSLAPGGPAAG